MVAPLVQRRIHMIHEPLHYLFGFASIFPNIADRYVGIDALGAGSVAKRHDLLRRIRLGDDAPCGGIGKQRAQ